MIERENKQDDKAFLATLEKFADVIVPMQRFRQWIIEQLSRRKTEAIPATLCHYTTMGGGAGILASNCLWATDCRCLNDTTELLYGTELLTAVIDSHVKAKPSEKAALFEMVLNYYVEHGNILREFFESYIISFSQAGDVLSQWRAYTGDAEGCCFEFQFHDSRLFTVLDNGTWAFELLPVLYDRSVQTEVAQEVLGALEGCLSDVGWPTERVAQAEPNEQYVMLGFVIYLLEPLVLSFKNPGFSEEQEWRAVTSGVGSLMSQARRRRTSGDSESFYVESIFVQGDEVNLSQRPLLPVVRVTLGPKASATAEEEVREQLERHGYASAQVAVTRSAIPLK